MNSQPIVIPGLTQSPLVTTILAVVASIVTEILALAVIDQHTAEVITGIAGIVVPLAVLAFDALTRHSNAKVKAAQIASQPPVIPAPTSVSRGAA